MKSVVSVHPSTHHLLQLAAELMRDEDELARARTVQASLDVAAARGDEALVRTLAATFHRLVADGHGALGLFRQLGTIALADVEEPPVLDGLPDEWLCGCTTLALAAARTWITPERTLGAFAVDHARERLIVAGDRGGPAIIHVLDIRSGTVEARWELPVSTAITALSTTEDGTIVAATGGDTATLSVIAADGALQPPAPVPGTSRAALVRLAGSPERVVVCAGAVSEWSLRPLRRRWTLPNDDETSPIEWGAGAGQQLWLPGLDDERLSVDRARALGPDGTWAGAEVHLETPLAIGPVGGRVQGDTLCAVGLDGRSLVLADLRSGRTLAIGESTDLADITALAIAPAGPVTGHDDGFVRAWTWSLEPRSTMRWHAGRTIGIDVELERVISGGADGRLCLHATTDTGAATRPEGSLDGALVRSVATGGRDGRLAVLIDEDGRLCRLDADGHRTEIARLGAREDLGDPLLFVSADGRRIGVIESLGLPPRWPRTPSPKLRVFELAPPDHARDPEGAIAGLLGELELERGESVRACFVADLTAVVVTSGAAVRRIELGGEVRRLERALGTQTGGIVALCGTAPGAGRVAWTEGRALVIADDRTLDPLDRLSLPASTTCLAARAEGLVLGLADGSVWTWDHTVGLGCCSNGEGRAVRALALGNEAFAALRGDTATIVSPSDREPARTVTAMGATSLAWLGSSLLAGTRTGVIGWSRPCAGPLPSLGWAGEASVGALRPFGDRVVVLDRFGRLEVLRVERRQPHSVGGG